MNKEVFGSNRNLNDLEKTVLWINELIRLKEHQQSFVFFYKKY